MSISSARPDNLEDFAKISRHLDHDLVTSLRRVLIDYHAFLDANEWGVFEADSLLGAFSRYLNGNDFTARWVVGIAAAFRAAGGSGSLVRLPDAAIKASLRAAGLDHGRRHVSFDKPVAYGSPPTTGYTDDPVNTASGNFVEVEHDLPCGGLIAGLSFDRTYNSRSDRVGAFGRGWSSWAAVRLVPGPDGAAYVGPDGQEAVFPRMGDGYGRVVGVDALVEPLESGLALCWFRGVGRWAFDEAGRPVSVSRGPGTDVHLEYDDAGRLVGMAHAGGKHVRLQWDDSGERIVALACSDGRGAAYRYDASGNLVEAEGADGTRRYEHDEKGRVVSVIDADGVVELVNTYDDEGRVVEQLSPFGRRTRILYLPGGVTVTMDDDEEHPANTFIHDAEGRLTAVVDGDHQQLSTSYDEWGNPTAVTERNGAVTIQEYDERNRPVRRVFPTGASLTFVHDDADRLVEVAVSTGAVTRYSYDGDERSPSQIVDPEGGVTRQIVRDGLVHRIVDPDGVTVDYEYDADGNVVAAADGHTARLERDAAGRVTSAVTPLGRRTARVYDAQGLLVERHDPNGGVWRYEHTPAGRLAGVTDPTGAREEIRYGEHGLPSTTVDALGHATARDYDVFGNLIAVVEPGGGAWRHEYDALMRLTATVDPTGTRSLREYDVNGTLVGTVDPTGVRVSASVDAFGRVSAISDGHTTESFERDALGQVVAVRRVDGSEVRGEYDLCGRRTLTQDASGAVTRVQYTPGGRVMREISASGRIQSYEHDARGRVAARIDGAGRRWEYGYDADGALLEIRLPTGETERVEYDECARVVRWSAPGEGVTDYSYDHAGRLVAVSDRAGASRYEYDAAGRLVAATDANGATTRYAYDDRGWLTQITDPLGGTVTRRYDAVGRLVAQIDQLGRAATAMYDGAGRVTRRSDDTGRIVRRAYDGAGRLQSFGAEGDKPTTIEYDELGRLVAIDEPGSFAHRLTWDSELRLVEHRRGDATMRWAYDADGERAAIGYPDGTETSYVRDAGGQVVAARHPALGDIELQRDAAGRLTGAIGDGMQALWRYDHGDLVHYEMQAGGTLRTAQLTRDAIGRVVQAMLDGVAHEFAYDPAGQLVCAATPDGTRAFDFDANGRLAAEATPDGTIDYGYDAAGQLISRAVAPGAVTRYEYDAAGYRVREHGPELERSYRWDGCGRLVEVERRSPGAEGTVTTSVVVDAVGELAEVDGTPFMWDTAHPHQPLAWHGQGAVVGEGAPWAVASGGRADWLVPDWQGTVGGVARDPWGAPTAAGVAPGGGRLGYRGEVEFDGEVWLRNRTYRPATRSFQQPDPLAPAPGTPSAANPYHYAANNPLGLADPLGLHPVSEHELNAIRDRIDRNILERGRDFTVEHAGDISAVTGIAAVALSFTPLAPLSPFLAGISAVTGTMSAYQGFKKGDIIGGSLDLAGVALAPITALKAFRIARAGSAMRHSTKGAGEALDLARGAESVGLPGLAARRYQDADRLVSAARHHSALRHTLKHETQMLDYASVPLAVTGMLRSHAIDAGRYRDPYMPTQVPSFGLR